MARPYQPSHKKAHCIVHQSLEGQRRVQEAGKRRASQAAAAPVVGAEHVADDDGGVVLGRKGSGSEKAAHEDVSGAAGAERPVDPKGRSYDVSQQQRHHHCHHVHRPKVRQEGRLTVFDGGGEDSTSSSENGSTSGGGKEGTGATSSITAKGQEDELAWREQMAKTASQVELDAALRPPDEPTTHSRLLTKKQLSEMAWGVRELSRRLGSMRLKFRVRNIFVLTKLHDADLISKTRELVRWLLAVDRDVRYTVYVENLLRDNRHFNAKGLIEELTEEYVAAGELEPQSSEGGTESDAAARSDLSRRLRYWDENMCRTRPHMFDFVITLGGDGTVLYASWLFQRIVPPVLSFALGSLGFLTKFDYEDYQKILTSAFNDGVTVSLRLRFEGTIMRSVPRKTPEVTNNGGDDTGSPPHPPQRDLVEELIGEEKDDEHTHRPDGTYEILNEIVVDRGPNPSEFPALAELCLTTAKLTPSAAMSYTELFGDDEHFTSILADGICVSTPTGSTAYNLAAGGSLCHPENPVMLVTSICAHTLSFRPIILPDTIVLRVGVPYDARTNSWASFDGRERVELRAGDYVTISASRYPFASIQPPGRRSEDWVKSISGKLGWNTRQKQKGYKEWDK